MTTSRKDSSSSQWFEKAGVQLMKQGKSYDSLHVKKNLLTRAS